MWNKVGSLAGEKVFEAVNLLSGVHKQVEKINEELESIQVVINGADRMVAAAEQDKKVDDGMKTKVKHLREAALRIEEVTEDYMITMQHQPPRDPGCAVILYATTDFIKTMILRLRISYEIQDINSSIRDINRSEIKSSLEQGSSSGSQNALKDNNLDVEEADVVGFEAPRDELIDWLKEKREDRTVIAVVGMGGQGKTTLAKTVYDKVIGDFDCHAWITVSQTYTVDGLLRAMLNNFFKERKEEVSKMDLHSLIKEVKNYMWQNRYVVFFDDVWNQDFWSKIKSFVIDNKKGSRIMITTRNMDVANFCKESSFVHILNLLPLSPQQSMELFCKKAFRNDPDGCCPTWLKGISLKIVEKCNGLPLAITAIGGLLACIDQNLSDWQQFCQTLIIEVDKNPNSNGITNILGLSYDALPYHLKSCFLYFGIYPEDYEVESKRLIRQWMAEGFVKSDSHKTLEKVAEQYLKELVHRSLVQVSSFYIDGKPKRCRVHDLLRDMILTKIKDLGFCHFVDDDDDDDEDDRSMFNGKIRRLQIATNSNDDHLRFASIEGSFIRSLHVFGKDGLPEDFVRIIPTKCRRLKVFDFQHNRYILENLGNLIHLRYLNFRSTNVESVPESIGNLQNLETLDLRWTPVELLPREINKLGKLRHLLVRWSKMMGGVGGLESLQTLYHVSTYGWGEEAFKELEKLRQLRSLGLLYVEPEYVSTLCCSINKMEHLEKLCIEAKGSIDWDGISPLPTLQKLRLGGKLERFPEWIPKHQNLVKLTLWFSKLTDDPMKSLMHLPNLLALLLWDAYEGETLHFENGVFQKLKKLELGGMQSLDSIHIGEGALPSLKMLELCSNLELLDVPFGMDHLGKLEVFCIRRMRREFEDIIKENVWIQNNVRIVVC